MGCEVCGFGEDFKVLDIEVVCDDCWEKLNSWFVEAEPTEIIGYLMSDQFACH